MVQDDDIISEVVDSGAEFESAVSPTYVLDDGRELFEHFRFVADKGQQLLRVDKFLVERMEKTSRNRIQQAADAECIIVNGRPVKSSYKVKPGDVISIVMDRPRYDFEIIAEDIPLDIVYEDEYLLVVNKPPGLVVHPGHGNYSGTLVNALAFHFKDDPDYDVSDPRLGLVHRIDKDTSGLLVVAKTPEAKTCLGKQFFDKTTRREYVALVWGDFPEDSGTIVGNIGRNPRNKLQMAVLEDPGQGKHAVTHYQVLERFGYVTMVKCVLETGRTHQIRVHMLYSMTKGMAETVFSRGIRALHIRSLSKIAFLYVRVRLSMHAPSGLCILPRAKICFSNRRFPLICQPSSTSGESISHLSAGPNPILFDKTGLL